MFSRSIAVWRSIASFSISMIFVLFCSCLIRVCCSFAKLYSLAISLLAFLSSSWSVLRCASCSSSFYYRSASRLLFCWPSYSMSSIILNIWLLFSSFVVRSCSSSDYRAVICRINWFLVSSSLLCSEPFYRIMFESSFICSSSAAIFKFACSSCIFTWSNWAYISATPLSENMLPCSTICWFWVSIWASSREIVSAYSFIVPFYSSIVCKCWLFCFLLSLK